MRVPLALAVQRNYYIHQMDVRTAFLHGVINDDVYISPPPGSRIEVKNEQALRLKKGLYGLKQAPRLWYQKWLEVMKRFGLQTMLSDKCVFRGGITKVQQTASPWNNQRIRDGRRRATTARIYSNITHMQFTVELQSGSVLM